MYYNDYTHCPLTSRFLIELFLVSKFNELFIPYLLASCSVIMKFESDLLNCFLVHDLNKQAGVKPSEV